LLHAEREATDPAATRTVESDHVEHVRRAFAADAVSRCKPAQMLDRGTTRGHRARVDQCADLAEWTAKLAVAASVDRGRTGMWIGKAENHASGRGLATPVRPEKTCHCAGTDAKGQLVDDCPWSVVLCQLADFDHWQPVFMNSIFDLSSGTSFLRASA